jgi:hypothetical protein
MSVAIQPLPRIIPPKPPSKPKRLPKRGSMTICAGFKSNYGVVLCADSQETRGSMKFDAPKLVIKPSVGTPEDTVRMLFAGAGDGPFIDKLVDRMWHAAKRGPNTNIDEVISRIEDASIEWHQRIWPLYDADKRPTADILFAIHIPDKAFPRLYRATGPIFNEVKDYAFVGYGEELGTFLAENFRPDSVDIEEDVGACLFILENAKKYVDWCGGDTQLAALMLDGSIQELKAWKASQLSEGISEIARSLYCLFGSAINLELKPSLFEDTAKGVVKEIRGVRSRLRRQIKGRVKVPSRLKRSVQFLYQRIKWPPMKDTSSGSQLPKQ